MLVNRQQRAGLVGELLASYTVLLFLLLPLRPLWLDELMEVVATAKLPLHDVIAGYAAHSAGQSPLGAVEQALAIHLLGFSNFAARLPAALASLIACLGIVVLARKAGLQRAWISLVLFASFPIVVRYGTEARPYSQAFCIASWLGVVFLNLLQRPAKRLFLSYALLVVGGLYTQPYVLFLPAAHCAFLLFRKQWAVLLRLSALTFIAAGSYMPWYLHSRPFWREEVEASQLHFHLQAKVALLIPRELIGSGYLGTVAVLILAAYGFTSLSRRRNDALLWVFGVAIPAVLVLLADIVFDYFFAIRQVIFVLPSLAILAAAGIEQLWETKGKRIGLAVALLIFFLDAGYAIRWFTKPHEDWSLAARTVRQHVESGACFLALPSGSSRYYDFFQPSVKGHECQSSAIGQVAEIVLVVSPYLINKDSEADIEAKLRGHRYSPLESSNYEPKIRVYVRSPDLH